mmetsp:Transcript_19784/g.62846  ORF Transcript_19784/g.62846 Transcript_19784/m.62846 type:complete len:173 (+) Transcript_19784:2-520(+)
MTSLRRFTTDDLFTFNRINLDVLTETYNIPFYLEYLGTWPDYCVVHESPEGIQMGYILGKAEGVGKEWHGHVTAVTVAPEFRRIGLARDLMQFLEDITECSYNGYFVDLFVRASNAVAIAMYHRLGYIIYRRVLGYYSGEEDAFDMRKAMPRDPDKASMVPLPHPVSASEVA